ncbi:MAG TPA: antibiotic biosynthesis monooxygenase [Kiloniellaceae bacterium]|nr:antibiotic biosynthesis monooxygenase [Kiloniellaceae bacterium]
MFVVTVVFEVKPDFAEDFRAAVLRQAEVSLSREKACYRFDVGRDESIDTRFFLYEIYADKAAFDLHLASDHFADFDDKVGSWVTGKTVDCWLLDRGTGDRATGT